MLKIRQMFKRKDHPHHSGGTLKKKTMVCSTEAAAISIVFHVLIIVFAGSIVAIEYAKSKNNQLSSSNIRRPKLERRQLQMPVKVTNLQKKSRKPKISSRMASASKSKFALPDMTGLGDLGALGFDRGGAGGRSLSSMGSAGSLGFGMSGINFFGARSKGEKMVFVLDAEKTMVEDEKGGYYTYKYAKDRILEMIDGMRSATLFNMMVYNYSQTVVFRPTLVPATPENKSALKGWMANLNSTPANVGQILDMGGEYIPSHEYESDIETEATSWLRSVQVAMEQKADNVFILGAGWGRHEISKEHQASLFELDLDKEEEWRTKNGWPPERVEKFMEKKQELYDQAHVIFDKENEAREAKGLPPRIIASGGWWSYMVDECHFTMPTHPPHMITQWSYDVGQIIEHMDAVYEYNYIPVKLKKPRVHFVKLIAEDANEGGENINEAQTLASLRKITREFKGKFEFLRGAKTMEDLIKYNPDITEE